MLTVLVRTAVDWDSHPVQYEEKICEAADILFVPACGNEHECDVLYLDGKTVFLLPDVTAYVMNQAGSTVARYTGTTPAPKIGQPE
jgi:hypothetical protein